MKPLKIFIRKLIIYTLILTAIGLAFFFLLPDRYITPMLPYINAFFFVITLITYYTTLRYIRQKVSRFVNYYLIATFAKLFLFIIVILIYLFVNKPDALRFVVTFFIYYLLYTIFEVKEIMKIANNSNDQTK